MSFKKTKEKISQNESLLSTTLSKLTKKTWDSPSIQYIDYQDDTICLSEGKSILEILKLLISKNAQFVNFNYFIPLISQKIQESSERSQNIKHLENCKQTIKEIIRQNLSKEQNRLRLFRMIKYELCSRQTATLVWVLDQFLKKQSQQPKQIKQERLNQKIYNEKILKIISPQIDSEDLDTSRIEQTRSLSSRLEFSEFMGYNLSSFIELLYRALQLIYQGLFNLIHAQQSFFYQLENKVVPKYVDDITLLIMECIIKNKNFRKYHQNLLEQLFISSLAVSFNKQEKNDIFTDKKKFQSLLIKYPKGPSEEEMQLEPNKNAKQLWKRLDACDFCKLISCFIDIFEITSFKDRTLKMFKFSQQVNEQMQKGWKNAFGADDKLEFLKEFAAFLKFCVPSSSILNGPHFPLKEQCSLYEKICIFFGSYFIFLSAQKLSRQKISIFQTMSSFQGNQSSVKSNSKIKVQNNLMKYTKKSSQKKVVQYYEDEFNYLSILFMQLVKNEKCPLKYKSEKNKIKKSEIKAKSFRQIHRQNLLKTNAECQKQQISQKLQHSKQDMQLLARNIFWVYFHIQSNK